MSAATPPSSLLPVAEAEEYARWFACLGESMRVRLLHAVASSPTGLTVGDLADALGISQATCSHHVRTLADIGFVHAAKRGTATVVSINAACCTGLPHATDAVMGLLGPRTATDWAPPEDVVLRAMGPADFPAVLAIYAEGINGRNATFDTEVPAAEYVDGKWLTGHRWIAEVDGEVAGWATLSPTSTRAAYRGVVENSVYVAGSARGRGVGKALLHKLTEAADADGLWTIQALIFPENRASIALHHAAGFRTVGVRERAGKHYGTWRDVVELERRRVKD